MAGGGSIIPVAMDVTFPPSVEQSVESILSQGGIDILIHCAGMGVASAAAEVPHQGAALQFATNYFGTLRVNSAVLPGMIEARKGLVVILSSVGAFFPIPFQSHYSASKAALEMYGRALRVELRPYGVKVALVQPGDTRTAFTASRIFDIAESSIFYETCRRAVAKMEHDELNGKDPNTVARRIHAIAFQPHPKVRNVIGTDYKALILLSRLLPISLTDQILTKTYLKP
jgi:short-subunit dehydrogenase